LFSFIFANFCFCGLPAIWVQYKTGNSEIIKNAEFADVLGKSLFRTKGRQVEINPKKLHYMDIFSDTIEIYRGDTWCRVNIYPLLPKGDTIPVAYNGWMKISTILKGYADFGKLSASISELTHIHFKPKEIFGKKAQTSSDTTAISNISEQEQDISEQEQEQEEAEEPPADDSINGEENVQ
jgi:hypothetical protein